MGDAQLRQVVTNLLSNAALHGRPPVHAAVRLAHAGPDRVVVLTVSDAGSELQGGFLPRAAERFGRGEHARSRPGAGLGLSLVLELVDQYGGELRLCAGDHHHRYQERFEVPCQHPASRTTASVILPTVDRAGPPGA